MTRYLNTPASTSRDRASCQARLRFTPSTAAVKLVLERRGLVKHSGAPIWASRPDCGAMCSVRKLGTHPGYLAPSRARSIDSARPSGVEPGGRGARRSWSQAVVEAVPWLMGRRLPQTLTPPQAIKDFYGKTRHSLASIGQCLRFTLSRWSLGHSQRGVGCRLPNIYMYMAHLDDPRPLISFTLSIGLTIYVLTQCPPLPDARTPTLCRTRHQRLARTRVWIPRPE